MKDTLNSGHVYSPHWEYEKQHWKGQGDRCCAAVHNGGRSVSFHQCRKPIKVWRDVQLNKGEIKNLGYCGIHDPVKVAERRKKRSDEYKAKSERSRAFYARRKAKEDLGETAIEAIKKIAEGHNDPRTLCQSILAEVLPPNNTP